MCSTAEPGKATGSSRVFCAARIGRDSVRLGRNFSDVKWQQMPQFAHLCDFLPSCTTVRLNFLSLSFIASARKMRTGSTRGPKR